MIRIMFVCLGNICRSPMGEFILRDMVKKLDRQQDFLIASAATSTEAIHNGVGSPVYSPAREELKKHGISCEGKRAVQLTRDDYDKFDYFFCMDDGNVKSAIRIFGGDKEGKVRKLCSVTGSNKDVADPWYTRDFDATYNDIYEACKVIAENY